MANELRLLFERRDEATKVRLVPHAGGGTGTAVPFEVDLSEDDYEDLRWYLESYLDLPDGGSVVRARRIEEQLRTWGRTLYGALFDRGEHRELLLARHAEGRADALRDVERSVFDLLVTRRSGMTRSLPDSFALMSPRRRQATSRESRAPFSTTSQSPPPLIPCGSGLSTNSPFGSSSWSSY